MNLFGLKPFTTKSLLFNISIAFYLISLFLPAFFELNGYDKGTTGIWLVVFGWLAFDKGLILIWAANPLMWYAIRHYGSPDKSAVSSGLASLLALVFMVVREVPNLEWCGSFLKPSQCADLAISPGPGYLFWLGSCISLFMANLIMQK